MDPRDRAVVATLVAILTFVAVVIAINALMYHTLPEDWTQEDYSSFATAAQSQGATLVELVVAGSCSGIVFYLTKGGRGD